MSLPLDQMIDLSNKPRSDDERIRRLEESQHQLLQMCEKVSQRCGKLEQKKAELVEKIADMKKEQRSIKLYSSLMTSRDLSAYNLLVKHLWQPLDKSIPKTITRLQGELKDMKKREDFMNMLEEFKGYGDKRYKALLRVESQGGDWPYVYLLDNLEADFLVKQRKKKGVLAEGMTVANIRPGMRQVLRKLRKKRNSGAHQYDAKGLLPEDRIKVLEDIKSSIPRKNFESEELLDEDVLKLLSLACELEERELPKPASKRSRNE